MSENLIIFNARIVTPTGTSATTSITGITTPGDIACFRALSIRIPILFLAENVPKNFHGG